MEDESESQLTELQSNRKQRIRRIDHKPYPEYPLFQIQWQFRLFDFLV